MARILAVLVILAAIAGIVAYKMEWIKFTTEDGKTKVEFDNDKFKKDAKKGKEEVKEGVKELEDGAKKVGGEVMEAIKPKKS
jgi:hypothetical protein